jgi:hypothetical protein
VRSAAACRATRRLKAARAPDLGPCTLDETKIIEALQIDSPGQLQAPRGHFAVGVRTGSDWGNSNLTAWQLLSELTTESIYTSPVTNNAGDLVEFDSMDGYKGRNIKRIKSVVPDAQRYLSAYQVFAEDLDSLEVYFVELEKGPDGDPPKETHKDSLAAWGAADLDGLNSVNSFAKDSIEGRPVFFSLITDADYVHEPPPCDCAPKTQKFDDYMLEYHDPLIGVDNWRRFAIELRIAIRVRIAQGSTQGSGELRLAARDKFGGLKNLTLIAASWDYDQQIDVARLDYNYNTSEPSERVYLTNVKTGLAPLDPSIKFPKFRLLSDWEGDMKGGAAPSTLEFPALKDKWAAINIKVCNATVSDAGSAAKADVTVSVNPMKAVITAQAKLPNGAHAHYKFGIAVDYLAQTDDSDSHFMTGKKGCQ